MKHNKLKQELEKKLGKLKRIHKKLLNDFDESDVHDFRVEIKKLRAFLRLLSAGQGNHDSIKLPKELKSFYGRIGAIRNIQLQMDRVNKWAIEHDYKNPCMFLQGLEKEENQAVKKLITEKDSIHFKRIKRQLLKKLPQTFDKNSKAAFGYQKTELFYLLAPAINYEETLHAIRKILKDFLYDWKYAGKLLATMLPASLSKPEQIEEVTIKLGSFQDDVAMLSFLQPHSLNEVTDVKEQEFLKDFKQYLQQEKDTLKLELKNELNRIINEKGCEQPLISWQQ